MPRHKIHDALLHLFKVPQRLGHPQHHAGVPHRMHRHGGGGHDKAPPGGHRQRDADGVSPAQHQRGGGLAHPRDQLRQRQPGLHIAAHRIENDQQTFDFRVFLDVYQLRNDMLVFGGLLVVRRKGVPLDGADDGEAVDGMPPCGGGHAAPLGDALLPEALFFHVLFFTL